MNDTPTVADAIARVLKDYDRQGFRSKTFVENRARLHLIPQLGTILLADLTEDHLDAYVDNRKAAGGKNATINRELSILRRGYRLLSRVAPRPPAFPQLSEKGNARIGFVPREHVERVIPHLSQWVRPVVWFLFFTGWRVKKEVLRLRWDVNVDFEGSLVVLPGVMTKSMRSRAFPFAALPPLAALLREQREKTPDWCPWVFHRNGERIKSFDRTWRTACRKAGVPIYLRHDFRRTAARNLKRAGVPDRIIMDLVGWSTRAMFDRYNIVDEADLSEGVAKLAASSAAMATREDPLV